MSVETTQEFALRVIRDGLQRGPAQVLIENDELWNFVWDNLSEKERELVERVDAIVIPPRHSQCCVDAVMRERSEWCTAIASVFGETPRLKANNLTESAAKELQRLAKKIRGEYTIGLDGKQGRIKK